MDLAFPLLVLATGLAVLAFDRKLANAMNFFSIGFGNFFPHQKCPTSLPPWSRERFENFLRFVRLLAVFFIVIGLAPLAASLYQHSPARLLCLP